MPAVRLTDADSDQVAIASGVLHENHDGVALGEYRRTAFLAGGEMP